MTNLGPPLLRVAQLAALLLLCACGITSQYAQTNVEISKALGSLDNAIAELSKQSSDWQVVIQELQATLVDDMQSTIRVELENLLRTGVLATGAEFRCDAEFLRIHTRRELLRIRNDLALAGGLSTLPVEPTEPYVCGVVPAAVDLALDADRRATLHVYGFDLRSMPITAEIVEGNGTRRNVTGSLGIASDHSMLLDLTATGSAPTTSSRMVVFSWNRQAQSVVRILNSTTPMSCTTRTETLTSQSQTLTPLHTGGDFDFHGHGPCSGFSLAMVRTVDGKRLFAAYGMDAYECNLDKSPRSDHTSAAGSASTNFLTITDPTETILGHNLDNSMAHSYVDSDHESDVFTFGGTNPVQRLEYVGDTDGEEAGSRTQVTIQFRNLEVQIQKCTP